MELAFIGTGMMGRPMIDNLLADGDTVTVWNRTAEHARPVAERGATLAGSPAEACTGKSLVLSCLSDDDAVRSVFGRDDVLEALGEAGAVHLSMSTISAGCADELAAGHDDAGAAYVAAPILGRPDFVAARKQGYLISGAGEAKGAARPVLERLGREGGGVFDFGDAPAAAHVAKIEFNFLIASALEAMAEAFSVVEKARLDPRAFHQMATSTLFGCPLYVNYGQQINERRHEDALFKLSLGAKDIRLAAQTAEAMGSRARLVELLGGRFQEALDHGRGEQDWTAIAEEVRAEAGLDG